MRVTDKGIFDRANAAISQSRLKFQEAADQNATGLRVRHAWDDPAAASVAVARKLAETRHDAIGKAVARAGEEINHADAALDSANQLVTRARELAIQLANDTYSAADRLGAAEEIRSIRNSMIALGNTELNGRYLFAGNLDRTPPFTDAGLYVGDAGTREVEIAPGNWADVTIPGEAVFSGSGGGVDLFAMMDSLSTALASNDVDAVRASVGTLDAATVQISSNRSKIASAAMVLELAGTTSRAARDQATADISREVDADPFRAASDLALAERGLEASMAAAAKSFGPSLLDKL